MKMSSNSDEFVKPETVIVPKTMSEPGPVASILSLGVLLATPLNVMPTPLGVVIVTAVAVGDGVMTEPGGMNPLRIVNVVVY